MILSPKDIRLLETKYLEDTKRTNKELIYKAALAIYESYNYFGNILIITGKGNNASDGYALATILIDNGIIPSLFLCEDDFTIDGKYYYDLAISKGVKIVSNLDNINNYDIIIDAIYGIGFKGELNDKINNIINVINNSNKYVISIDINSGLNALNGLAKNAIKSNLTISLGYYKYGHFLNNAKDYIDKLINKDLGYSYLYDVELFNIDNAKALIERRKNFSNKGDYGYVGIMGGSRLYPGAIKLASLAQNSLYAGCGVSRIIVPDIISDKLYPYVLEATIYPLKSNGNSFIFDEIELKKAINRLNCLSIGVGISLDKEIELILEYLILNFEGNLIIDADALTILSKMNLNILNNSKSNIILTPHLKEFSRITGLEIDEILNNPVNACRNFTKKYNVTLLLKGPTTIITDKNKTYFVNSGTPGMATAGSGDVLIGILTGLLGYLKSDIVDIVSLGAFINGLAGECAKKEFGENGMVSSDTARCVSKVMKLIET